MVLPQELHEQRVETWNRVMRGDVEMGDQNIVMIKAAESADLVISITDKMIGG